MSTEPDRQSAKSEEYVRFETLAKGLFAVPKEELDARLAAEKQTKKQKSTAPKK